MTSLSELWFREINQSPLILPAFITHRQSRLPSEDSRKQPFIIIPVSSERLRLTLPRRAQNVQNDGVTVAQGSAAVWARVSAEKPNSLEEVISP